MIDFDRTYELEGGTEYAVPSPSSLHIGVNGFAIGRGEAMLPQGMTFVKGTTKCKADIIGSGFAGFYLISSRLAEALRQERITGWASVPASFEDGAATCGQYEALSVSGRCGRVRYDHSEVIEKTIRPGRKAKFWRGAYFEQHTWDGSDIFTPENWSSVFLTAKVRDILRLFDLDGVTPVPLSRVERLILPSLLKQ